MKPFKTQYRADLARLFFLILGLDERANQCRVAHVTFSLQCGTCHMPHFAVFEDRLRIGYDLRYTAMDQANMSIAYATAKEYLHNYSFTCSMCRTKWTYGVGIHIDQTCEVHMSHIEDN